MARRYRLNNPTKGEIAGIVIGVIFAVLLLLALQGWVIMILFGALSSIFGWGVTLAFGEAIIVSLALGIVGSFFRRPSS